MTDNNLSKTSEDIDPEIAKRIDPILQHFEVPGTEIDKPQIRDWFVQMWEFEKASELDDEEQYLTAIGLFIYYAHNALDEVNIKTEKAREHVVNALRGWLEPEIQKAVTAEKASDNPFKHFVDTQSKVIDERYSWRNFLLTHKKQNENEWVYKMKRCWFAEFFIRFGRPDYIKTACLFDQIPWDARKDYVDLKLQNLFPKYGTTCQFTYKPAKG